MKLFGDWYLVKRPKTNREEDVKGIILLQDTPMWKKWYHFAMNVYGVEAYRSNEARDRGMTLARNGFHNGYLYCLYELGIKGKWFKSPFQEFIEFDNEKIKDFQKRVEE